MLTFDYPWFALLLILPFIMLMTPSHFTHSVALRFSYFRRLLQVTGQKPRSGSVVQRPLIWQRVLTVFTYLCLVMAAMKPVWVSEPITYEKSGRELMVAVDLSGSMEARDFVNAEGQKVRRVDGVKLLLDEFISQRQGDRIGLIAFGDDAYLQAPFTEDLTIISQLLDEMDVRMAGAGTALGDAIGVAVNHFEHAQSQNRVLMLLTDGRDTTSQYPPIDAAHFAGEHDITIYPIAIGDPGNVGEEGIDFDMLGKIASYTGGEVFEAQDGNDLSQVYDILNQREETLFESYTVRPQADYYYLPLLMAVVLNLTLLLISAFNRRNSDV